MHGQGGAAACEKETVGSHEYKRAEQTLAAHSEYEEGKPEGGRQALPDEGIVEPP